MTFYLSGVGAYFVFLIFRMFSDQECSQTDRTSWIVIVIASLFWVIVIPLSIIELRSKAKVKAQLDTMPKPMTFGAEARYLKTVQHIEETPENITPQLNSGNS